MYYSGVSLSIGVRYQRYLLMPKPLIVIIMGVKYHTVIVTDCWLTDFFLYNQICHRNINGNCTKIHKSVTLEHRMSIIMKNVNAKPHIISMNMIFFFNNK